MPSSWMIQLLTSIFTCIRSVVTIYDQWLFDFRTVQNNPGFWGLEEHYEFIQMPNILV